ncbi:MAG: hypothetical protein ACLP52_06760 [Streptosporangiaceae bacterium]
MYSGGLARGGLPSIRRIRRELHCGQDRAPSVPAYLAVIGRTGKRSGPGLSAKSARGRFPP